MGTGWAGIPLDRFQVESLHVSSHPYFLPSPMPSAESGPRPSVHSTKKWVSVLSSPAALFCLCLLSCPYCASLPTFLTSQHQYRTVNLPPSLQPSVATNPDSQPGTDKFAQINISLMVTSWGAGFSFLTENRRTSISLCHFLSHQDLMGRCWGDFSASWNPENEHQMAGSLRSCCPLIPSSALPVFPKSLFCTKICSLFFFTKKPSIYSKFTGTPHFIRYCVVFLFYKSEVSSNPVSGQAYAHHFFNIIC